MSSQTCVGQPVEVGVRDEVGRRRVVDQDVEPAEARRPSRATIARTAASSATSAWTTSDLAPRAADAVGGLLGLGLRLRVVDRDGEPPLGEPPGHRPADPGRRPVTSATRRWAHRSASEPIERVERPGRIAGDPPVPGAGPPARRRARGRPVGGASPRVAWAVGDRPDHLVDRRAHPAQEHGLREDARGATVRTTSGIGDDHLAEVQVGQALVLLAPAEEDALEGPEDVAGRQDHRRGGEDGEDRVVVERREDHEHLGDEPAEARQAHRAEEDQERDRAVDAASTLHRPPSLFRSRVWARS